MGLLLPPAGLLLPPAGLLLPPAGVLRRWGCFSRLGGGCFRLRTAARVRVVGLGPHERGGRSSVKSSWFSSVWWRRVCSSCSAGDVRSSCSAGDVRSSRGAGDVRSSCGAGDVCVLRAASVLSGVRVRCALTAGCAPRAEPARASRAHEPGHCFANCALTKQCVFSRNGKIVAGPKDGNKASRDEKVGKPLRGRKRWGRWGNLFAGGKGWETLRGRRRWGETASWEVRAGRGAKRRASPRAAPSPTRRNSGRRRGGAGGRCTPRSKEGFAQ